jgi:ATP-dependent Clp protease ATP-binding subunit ClpA
MTTNACDSQIVEYAEKHDIYTADKEELEDMKSDLESVVRKRLQGTHPFTSAFMGRVGRVVPFLPMANGDSAKHSLLGETVTVAKYLIEREQDKLTAAETFGVCQLVSSRTKHRMANIIARDAIPEAGVRHI